MKREANARQLSSIDHYISKFSGNGDLVRNRKAPVTIDATDFIHPVNLPSWSDLQRAIPNAVLRSALFVARKRIGLKFVECEEIYAQEGIRIIYTGLRLDMDDCDIWETAINLACAQGNGAECIIKPYKYLQLLNKADTSGYRKYLDRKLSHMNACAVKFEIDGKYQFSYAGSLILSVAKSKNEGYKISFDPKLLQLFSSGQFTYIDLKIRKSLSKNPIAKWLHGYYSSHAKPFPIKIKTLVDLSGSDNKNENSAKINMLNAFKTLTRVSTEHGQNFSYEIKGDLIHVERDPSKSQGRHLSKKRCK